jgi:hypothetical protein
METIKEAINWSMLTPIQRNELIAKHVMGTQYAVCPIAGQDRNHGNLNYGLFAGYWRCQICGARSVGEADELFQHARVIADCPKYSENMTDAWKIVEGGIFLEVFLHSLEVRTTNEGSHWRYIANVALQGVYVGASGMTAPHALCIAALRAVGVEVQDDK